MLMENVGSNVRNLDGFYNELRRKYPNTFTVATELGKGDKVVQRLPQLEKTTSASPRGFLPTSTLLPQRWTPDSFLCKVQRQKTQGGERQVAEPSQRSGTSVIIQDKVVTVPTLNRREYQESHTRPLFRLPSLRSQVEKNQEELRNRLGNSKEKGHEPACDKVTTKRLDSHHLQSVEARASGDSISSKLSTPGDKEHSVLKPDALGTIMKELLPNKAVRLINEPSRNSKQTLKINGACLSDSDSGVSVCAPIKVLRMKSRSAHGPPAATDIIKKFSANPKPAHGPVKADHTVIASIKSQAVNGDNKPKKDSSFTSCSINSNEKNQQWSRTPRVRFEDESEQEAESRYHDRCLLQKEDTGTIDTKSLNSHSTQSLESNKLDLRSKSPSPTPRETSQTISQQTINVPYRRQPFPPGVAKKVLIDIPRSGYTIRRSLYTEIAPVGTNITNKDVPQSLCKETTSLDGINLNVSRTNEGWKGQDLNISTSNNGVITQQGVSQTKSIERGITEVSSQVTVMRMKWGGSESSVSSQQSDSSSTLNLRPEPQPTGGELPSNLQKGAEISFYSKVKRSLHVRMKASSDSPVLSGNDQSKTSNLKEICSRHVRSLGTDVEFHLPSRFQGKENDDPGTKSNTNGFTRTTKVAGLMSYSDSSTHHRPKDLTLTNMERESAERAIPHKAPLFSRKMMKTFLKKGREKNYMVHLPSPPPSQDTRQHIHRDISSSKEKVNSRHEAAQPSGKMTARLISTQSDSSRVIELQCPQIGFQGLYLAKRNQNPDSGVYVAQLSKPLASVLPQGILGVGDEILEINRRQTKNLSLEEINCLLAESSCVLLHIIPRAAGL